MNKAIATLVIGIALFISSLLFEINDLQNKIQELNELHYNQTDTTIGRIDSNANKIHTIDDLIKEQQDEIDALEHEIATMNEPLNLEYTEDDVYILIEGGEIITYEICDEVCDSLIPYTSLEEPLKNYNEQDVYDDIKRWTD